MKKYLAIFKISWQNGFVYRLNFILWRVRSVILILTTYFLWEAVTRANGTVFGYTQNRILTYIFLTLVIRSLVLGARSIDSAGEIGDGRLSNYLVKPVNYHTYWLVRDLADKSLNIAFSIVEIILLYLVLKPPIYLQTNVSIILVFVAFLILAIFLNYILSSLTSALGFWIPENVWGFWFIFQIFQDYLGGVMYPLDIFPKTVYNFLSLLPFPYLLFFPANVYLGKIANPDLIKGFLISVFWVISLTLLLKKVWAKGLRIYAAEGR